MKRVMMKTGCLENEKYDNQKRQSVFNDLHNFLSLWNESHGIIPSIKWIKNSEKCNELHHSIGHENYCSFICEILIFSDMFCSQIEDEHSKTN